MSDTPPAAESRPTGVIRPGLLDRLKTQSGIRSDDAFARLIGCSRATLARLKKGEEPSLSVVITIAATFGLGLGEVVAIDSHQQEVAA